MLIILEAVSVVLVFVYLWYASMRKPVAWLYGIASSVSSAVFFMLSGYYASMILNGIYSIQGTMGYFQWRWLNPHREAAFRLRLKHHVFLILSCVAVAGIIRSVAVGLGSDEMYYSDMLLACGSITATWLEIRKDTSCWLWWIVCNTGYMLLYLFNPSGKSPLYIYAFLMFMLAVFSWFALMKWIRDSYTDYESDSDSNKNHG